MERLLQKMQNELEILAWDKEELDAHFQMSIKEHQLMDSMLSRLEEEHDRAIVKIELLEGEVRKLEAENLRLRNPTLQNFFVEVQHQQKQLLRRSDDA